MTISLTELFINETNAKTITVDEVTSALDAGAKITLVDDLGKTPLMYACSYNPNPEVIETLLRHQDEVDAKAQASLVNSFLDCEFNSNISMEDGLNNYNPKKTTPLMFACKYNANPEIAALLLYHGDDIQARNYKGMTPLMIALKSQQAMDIIQLLLNKEANIDSKDDEGRTPLMYAIDAKRPNMAIIELLLEQGAYIHARDKRGMTPLAYSLNLSRPNLSIVSMLLAQGASVHMANDKGKTPLMFACNEYVKDPKVIELLLSHGAKPNDALFDFLDRKCEESTVLALFNQYPR